MMDSNDKTYADKREKETGADLPSSGASPSVEKAGDHPHKKKRSFGNKTFDFVVWPLLQWVGVWGISLTIAREARNPATKFTWLNKANTRLEQTFTQLFEKPAASDMAQKLWGSSAEEWGKSTGLFSVLALGGTMLTPVTHWFEHRRDKISGHIDRVFHKTPLNSEEMAKEPSQTWGSMLAGRVAAIGVAYSIFGMLGPKRTDYIAKTIGAQSTNLFKKFRPGGDAAKFRSWADIAIFDLLFTSATATVNYLWSRAVAKKSAEREESARIEGKEEGKQELLSEITAKGSHPVSEHASTAASETERARRYHVQKHDDYRARARHVTPESVGQAV